MVGVSAEGKLMVVVINGELKLEYNRKKSISKLQQKYLAKMDRDMDSGITLNNEQIALPDKTQRAQFVADHLVHAYMKDNDQQIAALCAYLAQTLPQLKQVRVDSVGDKYSIDLKFDAVLENQVKVNFPPLQ
ncbi:hypothetical protein MNBD_GAMMA22-2674 [hydrothermal vent metagenome]|uniref:Uncharacterized protein n=1 Tax=hydrothermal vent metagenome TaxID=652676 RepID=A0A3B1AF38_9ZZZZ